MSFCSSLTFAAVAVCSTGLPLVCVKYFSALHLVRSGGLDNEWFCSISAQLATQIIDALMMRNEKHVGQRFFMIDQKLPRWVPEIECHLTASSI